MEIAICFISNNFLLLINFRLSWAFFYCNVWWLSIVWFVGAETTMVLYMRDCWLLQLNLIAFDIQEITDWQSEGKSLAKERWDMDLSISWPLNALLSKNQE